MQTRCGECLVFVLGRWMKEDKVTGERYLVDSEDVARDLDDIADESQDNSQNDN
jgi:hypothetical protein